MKSYCKGLKIDRAFVEQAYMSWLYSQAGKKNAWRIKGEHGDVEHLIAEITREISTRTLTFVPIKYEERTEGVNQKVRHIGIESVKEQVVEHVVILAIKDLFNAKIGHYQCAGIRGRGQLMASKAIRKWIVKAPGSYFVKADIRKCYESTPHEVVMEFYRKYVKSDDVLYCIESILGTFKHGLNLGGFFSLITMTLLLSKAYHYLEGLGKQKRGKHVGLIAHQIWFMDDILLIGNRKADVKSAARKLECYLARELGLTLKQWKVSRVGIEPIDMVGFVHRPGKTTIRARVFIHARRSFKRFAKSPSLKQARRVSSYWGYFKHTDSWRWITRNKAHRLARHAARMVSLRDRRHNDCVLQRRT